MANSLILYFWTLFFCGLMASVLLVLGDMEIGEHLSLIRHTMSPKLPIDTYHPCVWHMSCFLMLTYASCWFAIAIFDGHNVHCARWSELCYYTAEEKETRART